MLRVALTGGMGAGKSAASSYLKQLGFPVIDSDVLAHQVVAPGSPGLVAVQEAFGSEVITRDGSLDRRRLAQMVFNDPPARGRLEAIMHPLIRAESDRRGEAACAAGHRAAIFDIPLLDETGQSNDFDLVVTVAAPQQLRLERAIARGLSPAQARARMAAQVSDAEREAVADVVLDGSGTIANLCFQIDQLLLPLINDR